MSDDPDCLGMCAIDRDVCTGCGRTLDQINAALDRADGESDAETGRSAG
ncbi:hypothetical protein SAMN02982917_4888 [Azospirillum oryzae]|uniref:DUF1289 domain-containing protein n=1 Tax=Azospirillum oryzae TaxID=286727 RepID=A0A1X7H3J0_9PROT|nr:DUF1289 domain-containing protein [Azospirillum oryzae]SMF79165.1 hypothetical protein SAMN02982917_4888 [Azospirillum oryzae]